MTKAEVIKALKVKLSQDPAWAKRALLRIYQEQTETEQASESVIVHNTVGFRSVDGGILSSFADQYQRRGSLSEKQTAFLLRKMPIYARQLVRLTGAEKIAAAL
jgi:hypothetical protein